MFTLRTFTKVCIPYYIFSLFKGFGGIHILFHLLVLGSVSLKLDIRDCL